MDLSSEDEDEVKTRDHGLELSSKEGLNSDIWNIMESNQQKGAINFLSLAKVTPAKILFIARLQKYLREDSAKSNKLRLIIYSDDVLYSHLMKNDYFTPDTVIIFDDSKMPKQVHHAPHDT